MTRAGVSYFGVRIPRHARLDLQDIAARGYTAVLHTFSENDLAYYRGTMAEIVAASHDLGLEVQMCPWGLGRTFGGEAESRWVTFHPEACQVLDDGRRVATGCLNQPAYRAFCKEWADAALEAGTDYVFWDEPHWTVPEHVGVDSERWACCCDVCRDLSGLDFRGLTPEVQRFRENSVTDFLREMVAHVAARGGKNTICLLPLTDGPHGIGDWDGVAALPGLSVARDRSVLEELRRAGGVIRRPLRLAPRGDRESSQRRRPTLAAELRPDTRRHPGPRGGGDGDARGRNRRRLDVGVRGLRAHDPPRDPGLSGGVGGGHTRAHRNRCGD